MITRCYWLIIYSTCSSKYTKVIFYKQNALIIRKTYAFDKLGPHYQEDLPSFREMLNVYS